MANKKFSEFVLKTSTSDVSHIVGYNGAENVQITPANFVTGGGTGVFLPLAGGTMTGDTIHNDNVKSIYGTSAAGLQIFYNGSDSIIKETGSGDLKLLANSLIVKNPLDTETIAGFNKDGSVDLYFNGTKKFETTSTGISVTGDGIFTGDLTATGGDYTSNGINVLSNSVNSNTLRIGDTLLTSEMLNVKIRTNGIDSLSINSLGNSAFAGNGTFSGNIEIDSTLPTLIMTDTDTGGFARIRASNGGLLFESDENNTQADSTTRFEIDGSEKMRLDASGNLGVGTSSPTEKFEVNAGNILLKSSNNGGGNANNRLILFESDTTASAGQGIGSIAFYGSDVSGAGAGIKCWIKAFYANNGNASIMTFSTSDSTTNNQERMRIDSTGNVGINEDSPSAKLVVNQDSLVDTEGIFVQAASNPADGGVAIFKSASKIGTISALGGASSLSFMTDGGTERMRINAEGQVSINNTATGAALTVFEDDTSTWNERQFGNSNTTGAAQKMTVIRQLPSNGVGTILEIPFTSQGNANRTTIIKLWGHSAIFNSSVPKAFEATITVGHLTTLSNLSVLSSNGNIASVSISGMSILVTFTQGYHNATIDRSGLFLNLEYMTPTTDKSIIISGLALN